VIDLPPRGLTIVCEVDFLDLNKQFEGNPTLGYWLNFAPTSGAHLHELCGINLIPGAQCPNCKKPLLKVAVFSADDPVVQLDPSQIQSLPLLYCWTCAIPYGEFRYSIHPDGSVQILTYLETYEGAFGPDGPYDGYKGEFSSTHFSLEPQSKEERGLLRAHAEGIEEDLPDELEWPRHQVGGDPMIYSPQSDTCPKCGKELPTFAAIADNTRGNGDAESANESFVDNSGVQTVFLLCRPCSIVSVHHSCD
jgi:hypothetical protein